VVRKDLLAAGTGFASALALGAVAGTTAALAQQTRSDADLYEVRGRIAGVITQLQNLARDYGGNRVSAISALQAAETSLTSAVDIRGADQSVSDAVVRTATNEVQSLITRLAADLGDYGGNKAAAIASLRTALTSLNAALGTA